LALALALALSDFVASQVLVSVFVRIGGNLNKEVPLQRLTSLVRLLVTVDSQNWLSKFNSFGQTISIFLEASSPLSLSFFIKNNSNDNLGNKMAIIKARGAN